MQNDLSGHILLSNDFKLNNSILLGISKDTQFSIGSFLSQFENPQKISFDLVLLEDIKHYESMSGYEDDEWAPIISDPELDEKLLEIKSSFNEFGIDLSVIDRNKCNPDYLRDRSVFYDLFIIGEEVLSHTNEYLMNMIYGFNCPNLVIPDEYENLDHLLFLFDGTSESVLGVKRFIKLFTDNILNSTVTAMIVNDAVDKSFDEKVIVDFLLTNFIDVGVVFTTQQSLGRDLSRLFEHYPHSIILSGRNGAKSLVSQNVTNLLSGNNIPLFFSN